MKYNKIHIRKIILDPCGLYDYVERTLINKLFKSTSLTLKESLIDCIFEVKLRFCGKITNIIMRKPVYYQNPIKEYEFKPLTNNIYYLCEIPIECMLYFDGDLFRETDEIAVTIVLDMREGQDTIVDPYEPTAGCACYIKVNEISVQNAICNISHVEKRIDVWVDDGGSITINSLTHLKHLPIDLSKEHIYHDSITGEIY
jgi:hypothetical protein